MLVHKCCLAFIFLFVSIVGFSQTTKISTNNVFENAATIENCSRVNTQRLEFSPSYYYGGLVFVSSRNNKGKEDKEIKEPFFELYYSDLAPDGQPTAPMYFSPNLNSRLHEGPVSFSPDFQTIYFTRNNINHGDVVVDKDGDVNLQIFQADKGNAEWENLRALPFNKPEYNFAHPSLSVDGNQLFFSSDMPGGYGRMDLYMVEKYNGKWGTPKNLGPVINTSGDDIFPYIHHSGSLLFVSDGHGGLGGLDLFLVKITEPKQEVFNLGEPFNSIADDLGIIVNKNGKSGYFSSSREGGKGMDDLYRFTAPNGLIPIGNFELAVTVSDAASGEMIEGASVFTLRESENGLIENTELYDLHLLPTGKNGKLTLTMVRKPAGQMGEPNAKTNHGGTAFVELKRNQSYNIYVEKEGYLPIDRFYSTFQNATFDEIHLMLEPQKCVMMYGSVIDANRKIAVPSAAVKIDTDSGADPTYIFTNLDGKFSYCLPRGCNYKLTATKNGYEQNMTVVTTRDNAMPLHPLILLQPTEAHFANEPVRKGSVIVLNKIYYDFDKSYIRRGAAHDLDALVTLMKKYSTMVVEMVAHTDSRGTDEYNLELSLERARSAMGYLIDRGIEPQRIKAYGGGEKFLRNNCADNVTCTETEHQYNRRTEIKVIEIDEPVTLNYIDQGPDVIDTKN